MASYSITTNSDHESVLSWLLENITEYKDSTHQKIIEKILVKSFTRIVSDIYDKEIIQKDNRDNDVKTLPTKVQELRDIQILI